MYANWDEMFFDIIKNMKKNIKRVEDNSTEVQRKWIVWTIQKIDSELQQLIFGIELDNVSNAEKKAKEMVQPTEEVN